MKQDQMNWVFSYIFTLGLSLAYAGLLWYWDLSLWFAIPLAHFHGYTWRRKFPTPLTARPNPP